MTSPLPEFVRLPHDGGEPHTTATTSDPDETAATRTRLLRSDPLRLVFAIIAGITVASGVGQLLLPGTVLRLLGAASTPTSRHLFAIVGMFMTVIGALTLQALLAQQTPPYVIAWAATQKLGAFLAVAVGVARHLFDPIALSVALFDLATAVLGFLLWRRLRGGTAPGTRGAQ